MESYTKIVYCLLLRKIIAHLPPRDQLNMRRVNKDWEDEAHFVLRQNPNLQIRLQKEEVMTKFLKTFDLPGPMKFLSFGNIQIDPIHVRMKTFKIFAEKHGQHIRHLTILYGEYHNRVDPDKIQVDVKTLLTKSLNLESLNLAISKHYTYESDDPSRSTVSLQPLPNLGHVDLVGPLEQIGLFYQIVLNAPALTSMTLNLCEHPYMDYIPDSCTAGFLDKLKLVRMSSLVLTVHLSYETGQNCLLRELIRSEVKPQELVVIFGTHENNITETGTELLKNLIRKFCHTGRLQKLWFRNRRGYEIDLDLPDSMPGVKYLNVADVRKCQWIYHQFVQPMMPLTPKQLPNLGTLVLKADHIPLRCLTAVDQVFPTMRKLVVDFEGRFRGRPETLPPSSFNWVNQYPNLTCLDTYVLVGHHEFLDPILSGEIDLVNLTLRFKYCKQSKPMDLWDQFTGKLKPKLTKLSPLHKIVPPTGLDRNKNPGKRESVAPAPCLPIPALQNLRKLKTLELENVEPDLFVAVVHLTATRKIPRLSKLKMSPRTEEKAESWGEKAESYKPPNPWIVALKRFHKKVEI